MQSENIRDWVVNSLDDLKAQNITCIDVGDKTNVTDIMIIATGTSNRHVKSLADNVLSLAKKQGLKVMGSEGADRSDWVLIDLCGVVVHVMTASTRVFYDLERLWSDPSPVAIADD